jgi:hypothetical protein
MNILSHVFIIQLLYHLWRCCTSRNEAAYGEQKEAATVVYLNTYYIPFLGWKVRYMIYVSYIRRETGRGAGGGEYFKSKLFVNYEQLR